MSEWLVQVKTPTWELVSNSNTPSDPATTHRGIVDGLQLQWAIDALPPVISPTTVTFSVYDDGTDPDGWLPIDQGDPVTVFAWGKYGTPDAQQLVAFKGRVVDVSGVNHPRGGVVFRVVAADRLQDLASIQATNPLDGLGVRLLYDALTDDALGDVNMFNTTANMDHAVDGVAPEAPPAEYGMAVAAMDTTNVTTLDALNMVAVNDWRAIIKTDPPTFATFVTAYVNPLDDDPESVNYNGTGQAYPRYLLQGYDPNGLYSMDWLLAFHWTGTSWVLVSNPDYYTDTTDPQTAVAIPASALAFDVGEWRKTRQDQVNTVELQGNFELPTAGTFVQTVRRKLTELVAQYGQNGRSINSPLAKRNDAQAVGDAIVGSVDQVPDGYGVSSLTIAYDALPAEAQDSWADQLETRTRNWVASSGISFATRVIPAPGRMVVVTDIPDEWRLADGPALFGRLMGVQLTLTADTGWRISLAIRSLPASAGWSDGLDTGITVAELAALAPTMTPANVDPSVTPGQVRMARPTAV